MDISSSKPLPKSRDLVNSIVELNNLIIKDSKGYISANKPLTQSGILVEVTIEHYRHVSGFGRFMAGVMVGDVELKFNIKLIDLATNKLVHDSKLDTSSEFGESIFGATTSR